MEDRHLEGGWGAYCSLDFVLMINGAAAQSVSFEELQETGTSIIFISSAQYSREISPHPKLPLMT